MVHTSLSQVIETPLAGRRYTCFVHQYQACDYWIESDFSSASYFFAAAAVTGKKIILRHMFVENSLQGDSAFLAVLENMGCDIDIKQGDIAVTGPTQLRGIDVDMQHMPDVMMTLAAIAPFAHSPTRIFNVGNARVKESDRINAMVENLRQLGVRVDEEAAALTIYPGAPHAGCVKSFNDHRIAMAFAVLGLRVPGVNIDDVACVSKTFPGFFEMFKRL
jgi:3-phosphoshikimate 1-carboxyvinyltransferase